MGCCIPKPTSTNNYRADAPWLLLYEGIPYLYEEGTMDCVIVFSHTFGPDLNDVRLFSQMLCRGTGASVIAYEYPGYGALKMQDLALDGVIANLRTILRLTADYRDVFLMGDLFGAAVSCVVAAEGNRLAGIILVCPFVSTCATFLPFCCCLGCCDTFAPVADVARVRCPVHVIDGTRNDCGQGSQGKEIYMAAHTKGECVIYQGISRADLVSTDYCLVEKFVRKVIEATNRSEDSQ